MLRVIANKFIYIALMLLLISIVSFAAIHAAPNSFLSGGELNPNMSADSVAKLKEIYGLDKPLPQQYLQWIGSIVTLDFGVSYVTGESVTDEILKRVPITLFINLVSLVLVFVIALWLGIKAAITLNGRGDHLIRQISLLSFAMPSFYLALLLMLVFSVNLEWFPIAGLNSIGIDESSKSAYYLDRAWHLVLPIAVMVFVSLGSMIIYTRALTIEILKSDYYFFAKSRNLSQSTLTKKYILPNLLPPMVTLLGLSLPGLIGGSIILEQIYAIDGMGQLFFLSALSRDYPVIMGILMITALLTLAGNIIADLLLLKLNPFANR